MDTQEQPVTEDMVHSYLVDVSTALFYATGRLDGITAHLLHGNVPRLGDEVPPWDVRGWLLPHVMDLLPRESGIGNGRWRYWLKTMEAGALPDEQIPQVDFSCAEDASRLAAGKMLEHCISIIDQHEGHWRSEATSLLVEWIAWALHVSAEPSRLKPQTQEALYRIGGFCLEPLLAEPADYFGWLLSEAKGRGTDPHGFYPTPAGVVAVMAGILRPEGDARAESVCDPCAGTGRMLLFASNWSLRLYGQDVDRRCVLTTLINGAFYAPWLSFPFPESVFTEHAAAAELLVEELRGEPCASSAAPEPYQPGLPFPGVEGTAA